MNIKDPVELSCRRRFGAYSMNHYRVKEWLIYGARTNTCEICKQPPGKPCLNMSDVGHGKPIFDCRVNAVPHEQRIDWEKILIGLTKRGYTKELQR